MKEHDDTLAVYVAQFSPRTGNCCLPLGHAPRKTVANTAVGHLIIEHAS